MKIGLIGDYQASVTAHRAIPLALDDAARALNTDIDYQWLATEKLDLDSLHAYAGLWCVPASPYRDAGKVLSAIGFARSHDTPFLGTCGGYQHAALEFARHALGYHQADNAEVNAATAMPLIAGLACKLYNAQGGIRLLADSRIAAIYGTQQIHEEYFCGYGVNRDYLTIFEGSGLVFSGFDQDGDPRALEIPAHRFFVGTAFQPERSALRGESHPLIAAFVRAAMQCQMGRLD